MNQQLRRNREAFADLVYTMGTFTRTEIVSRFNQQRNGDIILDGGQSLDSFLKELRGIGVLSCSNGTYNVRP